MAEEYFEEIKQTTVLNQVGIKPQGNAYLNTT